MRKLAETSNTELLARISWIHKSEIQNMADVVLYLDEIKYRALHLRNGYKSIYKFLADEHAYPKNQAYLRMRAAEAFAIEPTVEDALRENRICATYLMQAMVAIRREHKRCRDRNEAGVPMPARRELIQKIIANGEARRTIAEFFPELQPAIEDSRPLANDLTLYQFAATKEDVALIERAKELLSTKVHDGNIHDVVMEMVKLTIKKLEPKKSAKPDLTATEKQRQYLSVANTDALFQKAEHQCEYISPNGNRCTERCDLQVDHVIPIAHGGTDSFENLRILCGAHNRYTAKAVGLSREKREFRKCPEFSRQREQA